MLVELCQDLFIVIHCEYSSGCCMDLDKSGGQDHHPAAACAGGADQRDEGEDCRSQSEDQGELKPT